MNSKQMGKQGEQLFQQIMERKGYTVKDVSTNSQYWDKDIDFIVISSTSGLERTFEIKWDSRINNTNNLYLEMTNIHKVEKVGLTSVRLIILLMEIALTIAFMLFLFWIYGSVCGSYRIEGQVADRIAQEYL